MICGNEHCGHESSSHHLSFGACDGQITDYYGTWGCMCLHFQGDAGE